LCDLIADEIEEVACVIRHVFPESSGISPDFHFADHDLCAVIENGYIYDEIEDNYLYIGFREIAITSIL
jgi:hypothetical protein